MSLEQLERGRVMTPATDGVFAAAELPALFSRLTLGGHSGVLVLEQGTMHARFTWQRGRLIEAQSSTEAGPGADSRPRPHRRLGASAAVRNAGLCLER